MKIHILCFSALFIFSLIFSLYGAGGRESNINQISNVNVSLKLEPTPIFNLQNISNTTNTNDRWLNINVSYTPYLKRGALAPSALFNFNDDFRIKFEVAIPNLINKKIFLLSNTIVYWPIEFNGKRHYALALISPKILNKTISSRMNNTFLKEMVKAKVSFYFNKKIIAEAYYPASASASKAAENFFKNLSSSSNVIMLNKAILSRNNTPWLSINFGKYELIKQ